MHREVKISEAYTNSSEWIESLPQRFAHEGTVIYDKRNQIRVLAMPDGRLLNVKRYCVPIFINRLVYTFFRRPKAKRAYVNALKLSNLGVCTPQPVAYILEEKHNLLTCSYLITEQSPLKRNFYEFGEGSLAGREDILIAFAQFTARMHGAGVYHKDYSPGNILFDYIDGKWQIAVVDINRLSYGKVDMTKGCRNFERLWGNVPMMRLVATEYAQARGFDVAACRKLVLAAWRKFWRGTKTHFDLYTEQ